MRRALLILTICTTIWSCVKEEPIVDDNSIDTALTTMVVGDTTDVEEPYCHNELNLTFYHQFDSLNLYSYATEMLDIDCDGVYDLQFEIYGLNADSLHLLNGQLPNPFPHMKMTVLDDISVRTMIQYVPAGLGQTAEYVFVDTIQSGTILNSEYELSSYEANSIINMWVEAPSNVGAPEASPWKTSSSNLFMVVAKGSTYCWVQWDNTDPYNPSTQRVFSKALD